MIRARNAVGMVVGLTLALAASASVSQTLQFSPVGVPVTDAEKRAVLATPEVGIGGGRHPLGYHVIARSGDRIGEGVFGRLHGADGQPLKATDGSPRISADSDFSSLIAVGGTLFNITHFESLPGAMYLTEMARDGETGHLTPLSTVSMDFSAVGGVWSPCAGVVTPWNSHLGSEEYPPDARGFAAAKTIGDLPREVRNMGRYFGVDVSDRDRPAFELRRAIKPYRYGYPVEIEVKIGGTYSVTKHYAMGRHSLELAYVMPDQKTVYMSQDGNRVGFFMFVADRAGDLSAGTLHAAIWRQESAENGGRARLDWVGLGHATDDQISTLIDNGIQFSDIFETAEMSDRGQCPVGFEGINTENGPECLRLRAGMEAAASRLEPLRRAAMLGATTEFQRGEGITFDAASGTLYLALTQVQNGMEDGGKNDRGSLNDIRLAANPCGTVYALGTEFDFLIDSQYVAKSIEAAVIGVPKTYPKGDPYAANRCDVDAIANPDNLTFIAGYDTLIIAEDSARGHQNDAVWAWDVKTRTLTRILTTPYGSEATSPYWYGDIGGSGYLMTVVQHPYGESDSKKRHGPKDARSYVGYIGPFPALDAKIGATR